MWHGIAEQLSVALGKRYLILERRALSAEPNERRLFISDGKQPLFIKLAPRDQLDRLTCSASPLPTGLSACAALLWCSRRLQFHRHGVHLTARG